MVRRTSICAITPSIGQGYGFVERDFDLSSKLSRVTPLPNCTSFYNSTISDATLVDRSFLENKEQVSRHLSKQKCLLKLLISLLAHSNYPIRCNTCFNEQVLLSIGSNNLTSLSDELSRLGNLFLVSAVDARTRGSRLSLDIEPTGTQYKNEEKSTVVEVVTADRKKERIAIFVGVRDRLFN